MEVPGRAWLYLNREGPNSLYIRIATPEFPLELDGLIDIFLLLKWHPEGKEQVAINLMLLHLVKTSHQGLIRIGIPLVNPSCPDRTHIR